MKKQKTSIKLNQEIIQSSKDRAKEIRSKQKLKSILLLDADISELIKSMDSITDDRLKLNYMYELYEDQEREVIHWKKQYYILLDWCQFLPTTYRRITAKLERLLSYYKMSVISFDNQIIRLKDNLAQYINKREQKGNPVSDKYIELKNKELQIIIDHENVSRRTINTLIQENRKLREFLSMHDHPEMPEMPELQKFLLDQESCKKIEEFFGLNIENW